MNPYKLPAFPSDGAAVYTGMTLRDYFAAKAMASLIAVNPAISFEDHDQIAEDAYSLAEAMIHARDIP